MKLVCYSITSTEYKFKERETCDKFLCKATVYIRKQCYRIEGLEKENKILLNKLR